MKPGLPVDTDALVREGKLLWKEGEGITPENLQAFSFFSEAALAENAEGQYLVSECYRQGCGVQRDEARSLAWLRRSAESGFPRAFLHLGVFYQRSVPKNEEEAIKWYEKAAEAGLCAAGEILVSIYKNRNDVAGELRWRKEVALQGIPESLWDVRTFYERRDGEEMDLPEAFAWLSLFEDSFTTRKNSEELACFHLDPESANYKTTAQELQALMSPSQLEEGNRRYQDLVGQRVKVIRTKAEQGSSVPQYDLGWCYWDGYDVPKDQTESVKWWRMAAEQGEERALNAVGYSYKHGEGVEQDHQEAIRWFRQAAERGNAAAQYSLGHSLCMGLGVPEDYVEAEKWIRKSAEARNAVAQHGMGFLYEHGYGVPQDQAEAMRWYRKAAERGHAGAQKAIADDLGADARPA